jgi:hypothetical protein
LLWCNQFDTLFLTRTRKEETAMSISFPTVFADLGKVLSAYQNINSFAGAGTPVNGYAFTVTAVTTAPIIGAVYSNNGYNYTVIATVKAVGTNVAMVGAGPPLTSGTLTKQSGTGDGTLTFSAVTAYSNPIGVTVSATTTAPAIGTTYSNNGNVYTVISDVVATGTLVALSGNGLPNVNATLTKVGAGTGDATMTVSAVSYSYPNWVWDKNAPSATVGLAIGTPVKTANQMNSDILTRLSGVGLTGLIASGWQSSILGIDSSLQGQKSALVTLLQNIIITRVNNDSPQQNPTSFQQAMVEFIRQMNSQTITVTASTLGGTTPSLGSGNSGTSITGPTPVLTTVDQSGLNLDYMIPETMTLECTQDQFSGATAGSEVISVTSPAQVSSLSYLWPGGSGLSTTLTMIDPTQGYGSGGNLIGGGSASVGAFKAFTGAVPTGWAVDTNASLITDGTTNNYSGLAHCVQITGVTSTQFGLYQTFANAGVTGGSTISLLPNTVYHFYCKVKTPSAGTAGVLAFSLVNNSNGTTVINDNAGNANTISLNVATANVTTWQTVSGSFRTPTVMPTAGIRLRVYSTTAVANTTVVYIDFPALSQPAAQTYGGVYAGGPFMSIFRGSVDVVRFISPSIGDYWTFQATNTLMANNVSATNTGVINSPPLPIVSLNQLLNQTLNLASYGLILPTAAITGANNQQDNLIA